MKTKKTTIQDIANYVNVSIGTVDRVNHNRGKVSSAKRKNIMEAFEIIDFNPNFLASTLALGKQYRICSPLPQPLSIQSYWAHPKQGFEQTAVEYKDFGITHYPFGYNPFDESSYAKKVLNVFQSPRHKDSAVNVKTGNKKLFLRIP